MLELNKIYKMDAIEGLMKLDNESVDLCVTDPPYGQFKSFANDRYEDAQLLLKRFCGEIYRVLKKGSLFFLFYNTGMIDTAIEAAKFYGFGFERILFLYKPNDETGVWRKWLLTSEAILIFRKTYSNQSNWQNPKKGEYVHDVMFHNYGNDLKEDYKHPTIKPISVVRTLIESASAEEQIVLDPFMGSGTTAFACKQINRKFIGFEIEPKFIEVCGKRLEQQILKV